MLNTAKSRNAVNAIAALGVVTHTPHGNERSTLARVTQSHLRAIHTGRQAVDSMKAAVKDLEVQVQGAENLVIQAINDGKPVGAGLFTPAVDTKIRFARISWKLATEKLWDRLGLSADTEHEVLKAAVEPKNVEVDVLVIK